MPIFPQRTIPDHAVSVEAKSLVPGLTYFVANFIDPDMLIPELKALTFVGKGANGFKKHQFVFQDAESFRREAIADDPPCVGDPVAMYVCSAKGLASIYEFDAALDVLLGSALRRWERRSRSQTKEE
ncbi:MAG: hypothetical protein JSS20_19830 [Proteobacteria bacterium]|nr:hypothetical protein [Pseudomonadota bacterium]